AQFLVLARAGRAGLGDHGRCARLIDACPPDQRRLAVEFGHPGSDGLEDHERVDTFGQRPDAVAHGYGAHALQVAPDGGALARRHVPSARAVVAVEESGGEARTYLIDNDLILKVQRPQQLRPLTSLAKEVFFLEQLAALPEDQRVSVPRVIGHGREQGVEYT